MLGRVRIHRRISNAFVQSRESELEDEILYCGLQNDWTSAPQLGLEMTFEKECEAQEFTWDDCPSIRARPLEKVFQLSWIRYKVLGITEQEQTCRTKRSQHGRDRPFYLGSTF